MLIDRHCDRPRDRLRGEVGSARRPSCSSAACSPTGCRAAGDAHRRPRARRDAGRDGRTSSAGTRRSLAARRAPGGGRHATAFFNPASTGLTPMSSAPSGCSRRTRCEASRCRAGLVGPGSPALSSPLASPGGRSPSTPPRSASARSSSRSCACPTHSRCRRSRSSPDLHDGWREFVARTWVWLDRAGGGVREHVHVVLRRARRGRREGDLGGARAWALILGGLSARLARRRLPLAPRALAGRCCSAGADGVSRSTGWRSSRSRAPAYLVAARRVSRRRRQRWCSTRCGRRLCSSTSAPAALSRVSAYDWFGSLAFQPLGLAIAGPLAAGIGRARPCGSPRQARSASPRSSSRRRQSAP